MRFLMILVAAAAVYASIYVMKKHGIEPGSLDFWIGQASAIAGGACAFLSVFPKKKKDGK